MKHFIAKRISLACIASAIAEKQFYVGVQAFVNTCRPASLCDLLSLQERVKQGTECLIEAYKDSLDRWHFATV